MLASSLSDLLGFRFIPRAMIATQCSNSKCGLCDCVINRRKRFCGHLDLLLAGHRKTSFTGVLGLIECDRNRTTN